jgi:hypothetical protein
MAVQLKNGLLRVKLKNKQAKKEIGSNSSRISRM